MGIVDVEGVLQEVPRDEPAAPLKPSTLREWLSVTWDTPNQEVVATTPVMTGLFATEVVHLAASWIEKENGDQFIRLPHRAKCVAQTDGPCGECRRIRDGHFSPARRARRIPVHDDRLANLLQVLGTVQEQLGLRDIYTTIGMMVDRSSIQRDVSPQAFRNTHGVAIAAKGYTRREIRRWMGKDPDTDYGHMRYAKDYQTIAETSPWDELEALGTGEFRP